MQLKSESSSVGRARPCQGRGRGFESRLPLINEYKSRDCKFSNKRIRNLQLKGFIEDNPVSRS